MAEPRIRITGLGKSYGHVVALDGVDLLVAGGTVVGVLGHNGAGKTTLIDVLSTKARPSAGRAEVCGLDVVRDGHEVRRRIGLTGQFAAVDDALSGVDNLVLVARLLGASPRQARARAAELVDAFGLAEVAGRPARTYSGGLRRRLDLAASLVGAPEVLFLDEPTTGLDPVSRTGLWALVERLAAGGTTIVLTTQYLEEADRLADQIVVLALGRVAVSGTPADLKARLGNRTATITFADERTARRASHALDRLGMRPALRAPERAVVTSIAAPGDIAVLVRVLDAEEAEIRDLKVSEPTLDDVYLSLHRSAGSRS
ncbi:ATP-binding cassette domain-containing protein [Amycolatopsis anabasis]|uniref:ATP-binding cassette domain-containing protein n=1 Tax=Amycolatopsis anabasis TaxID=1840409 RepID=UPI00131EB605|nr:ATP-binding cassette domain-containing protein [Amycolatopsis anabasis]